jgi:OHCU decarboxylase
MLTLRMLNSMNHKQFTIALGSLFEGPPWIVQQAWSKAPFASLEQLHGSLREVMDSAPLEQQLALLRVHPDLVGRAALAGTLTPASTGEQAYAGLNQLTSEEIAAFQHLNHEYRTKFDFPFIICARENKKESILQGFARRLHNSREREINIALGEVAKISLFRLRDTVQKEDQA